MPAFNGILPHVVILVDMKDLIYVIIKQRHDIVIDFWEELDRRHVGKYTYQENGILEEVTQVNGRMM